MREKNPNKLNIGALSPGGQVQLLADRFLRASKLKIEKIPYKGAAELATALLTGDIHMSFFAYSAGAAFMKDGKLKPIAIATEQRSTLTPDIPTFKELGMPDVTGEAWVALFARADTPKPVIAKLQAMITEASKDPEYVEKIRNAGNDPWVIAPDKIDDVFKADFKILGGGFADDRAAVTVITGLVPIAIDRRLVRFGICCCDARRARYCQMPGETQCTTRSTF